MTKIAFVLGTRPEIIKLYSCIRYCEDNGVDFVVINTDQHYDKTMRDVFFDELHLPQPQYMLGIGSASHAMMVAKMLIALEEVFTKEQPSVVVVQGDTNTVLAGCLTAVKMGIPVAHIEAGLRSYDRTMPEEYNRVVVDHCANYLFAPTERQATILRQEGLTPETIHVTGNTVVDAVYDVREWAQPPESDPYILLTCHRPANTDNPEHLNAILNAVQSICVGEGLTCIFPAHPRLKGHMKTIEQFDRIKITEPLGYSQMIGAMQNAEMVLTDSGGIQEESCILQKKCLILRTNTERPETLDVGGAVLIESFTSQEIVNKFNLLQKKTVAWSNPFGDGKSAERIIGTLKGL